MKASSNCVMSWIENNFQEEFETRLHGLQGQVKHLVASKLEPGMRPRLLIIEGERLNA